MPARGALCATAAGRGERHLPSRVTDGGRRGDDRAMQKNYNLIVEPWRGNRRLGGFSGRPGYRWKVTWRLEGDFYAEGFEDTHAAARAAAEKFLTERGIELMGRSRQAS